MAQQNRDTAVRPIARGSLTAVRWAAFGSAVAAGLAIGAGTLPNALATGGVNIAIAVAAAIVATVGMSVGWHIVLGFAAHAREPHERSLALGFGGALSMIGVALSGWYLASVLAGPVALQSYQRGFLDQLNGALERVAANAAVDQSIVDALDTAGANLNALASAEESAGVVSGRARCGVVCLGIKNAATGMTAKAEALTRQQRGRTEALARARDALGAAIRDVAANDAVGFEENAQQAAASITAAANMRLVVPDLGAGLDLTHARQQIGQSMRDIGAVVEDSNTRRRTIVVPVYQPIDAKGAIMARPQPLAWIAAIVIELLPLLLLGLLLTIWRDPEDASSEMQAEVQPLRPRAILTPAE